MMPKKLIGPSTRLFPMPTLMVCVKTGKDTANILTIAWGGIVNGSPPCIGIGVGKDHYSTPFIRKEKNFTVNIPNSGLDVAADYCGIVRGARNPDKAKTCGLTLAPSTKISSPIIEDCPMNFECKLYKELDFDGMYFFVGEVVETHIDEAVLDARGRIDSEKLDPLIFLPNSEYRRLGALVSRAFSVGKKAVK
ncbi:MAG: flavin reductase family protein [Dehalococcoidales bacterium]|nr:flavin reductase family protein [Dehalococcoidales bacterium]